MELHDNNFVQFSQWVEQKAILDQTTLMDIICIYCAENDIEYSEIVPYLTDTIKSKIHVEAERLRLYKSTTIRL